MKQIVKDWQMDYNRYRHYISLHYMTPAGFAGLCLQTGCIRPRMTELGRVQDGGILCWALDHKEKAAQISTWGEKA